MNLTTHLIGALLEQGKGVHSFFVGENRKQSGNMSRLMEHLRDRYGGSEVHEIGSEPESQFKGIQIGELPDVEAIDELVKTLRDQEKVVLVFGESGATHPYLLLENLGVVRQIIKQVELLLAKLLITPKEERNALITNVLEELDGVKKKIQQVNSEVSRAIEINPEQIRLNQVLTSYTAEFKTREIFRKPEKPEAAQPFEIERQGPSEVTLDHTNRLYNEIRQYCPNYRALFSVPQSQADALAISKKLNLDLQRFQMGAGVTLPQRIEVG